MPIMWGLRGVGGCQGVGGCGLRRGVRGLGGLEGVFGGKGCIRGGAGIKGVKNRFHIEFLYGYELMIRNDSVASMTNI